MTTTEIPLRFRIQTQLPLAVAARFAVPQSQTQFLKPSRDQSILTKQGSSRAQEPITEQKDSKEDVYLVQKEVQGTSAKN